MEKEYWLFTLLTGGTQYVNCYFAWFPSKSDLQIACNKFGNSATYAIINMAKLTEEQFNKLTKEEDYE